MSSDLGPVQSPQEIKKDLLGLDEGWKNWLRPPDPIPLSPKPESPLPAQENPDTNIVELNADIKVKDEDTNKEEIKHEDKGHDEYKKEKENESKEKSQVRSGDKRTTDDYDEYDDDDDDSDDEFKDSAEESEEKRERRKKSDFPYDTFFVKNYKSFTEKQDPLDEYDTIFKESPLPVEKQIFHQKVLNKIVKNLDNPKKLQSEYISYIRKAAELEIFSCNTCEYQTIHKENLKTHLYLIHKKEPEEKKYKCMYKSCQFKAKNLAGLKIHQSIHIEPPSEDDSPSDTEPLSSYIDNSYSDDDTKPTRRKKRYKNKPRIRSEDERARYECDICDIKIVGRDNFVAHNKTHKNPNNPKRYVCHVCDYSATKLHLKKHLLKVHNIETKGVHELKKHKCPHCDYITDTRSCLNSHLIVHKSADEVPLYKCTEPDCRFTTKHRVSWKNHMKFHEPNQEERKKFMCDVCSKSFIKKQNLEGHMLIHKSIEEVTEIYKCPDCNYQTKFKCHLITHKQKHQEAKYICDVCGFRTRRQGSYKMHCRLHIDKSQLEMFKCNLCPYETRFKHDLRKHKNSSIHSILAKRAAQALENPNKKKRKKRSKKKPPADQEPAVKPEDPQSSREAPMPPLPAPPVVRPPVPPVEIVADVRPRPLDDDFVNRRQIDDGVASRLFYQFSLLNAQMQ